MNLSPRRVGIIGVGHVGAHCAFSLAAQGIVDELVLVDTNRQKAISECQDQMCIRDRVIIMGIQVFMRYVLAKSLPWPEELTRYLFIWFVFLGISYGIRYNIHIKVDIIETVFPKVKPFLIVIQDLLFLTFCIMMIRPLSLIHISLCQNGGLDLPG